MAVCVRGGEASIWASSRLNVLAAWASVAIWNAAAASPAIAPEGPISNGSSTGLVVRGDRAQARPAASCVSCHEFNNVLTHPTGVLASIGSGSSLPLVNGTIGCVTCHDAPADHSSKAQPVGVRPGSTGRGLCAECHESGSGHASAGVFRAHLRADATALKGSRGIDAESTSCLSCHDGATASEGSVRSGEMHAIDSAGAHPVGAGTTLASSGQTDHVRLVNEASLDRRIRLFDKAVGCGSCHSVYSRNSQFLVMSNDKSHLCLSCHIE